MAEVLAIIGGVAGGIQMADAFLKLASKLEKFIRTVRYAPQQVRQFRCDLSTFSASLHMFAEVSERGLKYLTKAREREHREKYIAGVIQECEAVKQGFKQLLSRFFEDVIELPSFHGYLDRVRWYLGRTSVAGLKISLESAKSSITLFNSLHTVEFLHRKIDKLIRKSQEVPIALVKALRKTKRQLKERRRATRDAHQLLFDYLKANVHSNLAPLIQDIRPVIQETHSIERLTTETLRNERLRILRQCSPTSTSQYVDNRSPSPSPERTVQEVQGPRIPSPAPGHTSISPESIPSPPTPRSRAQTHTARARSPNAGNSPSVSETIEHMDIPRETSSLRDPSSSVISTVRSRSPPIIGHIIRDDGTHITETIGEWRSDEARQFGSESSGPNRDFHNKELSVSSLDNVIEGGEEKDEGEEVNEEVGEEEEQEEEENEESANNAGEIKVAERGPYKAMPPFLDSDWKEVRRRPST